MDRDALVARCKVRFKDTGNAIYSDANWVDYINEAIRQVWRATPWWPFRAARSTSLSYAASTRAASLPTDATQILAVRDATNDTALVPIQGHDVEWIIDPSNEETGLATRYRVFGTTLEIYPLPQSAITVHVEYRQGVNLLDSGSEEPVFPETYHDVLVHGALALAYEDDGNLDKAALQRGRFDSDLAHMVTDLCSSDQGRHYQVVDDFWDYQ